MMVASAVLVGLVSAVHGFEWLCLACVIVSSCRRKFKATN